MILAGDVGGTKTVLALCESSSAGGVRIVREAQFPCDQYPSLEAIVDEFLGGPVRITAACLGVAGPVTGGSAKITNLPWTISEAALSARLGGAPVTLLNDLQATALGVLVLPPEAFETLQTPATPPDPHGTIAVIAPGTGLGAALLVSDGTRYRALPTESGHADFAAGTDEELALFRFLKDRHGPHVSVERILSGDGIGALFDFSRAQRGAAAPEPAWLSEGDRNAAISHAALEGRDQDAVHALELFAAILGAEAGNSALRALTTGGVVIGGGIPPKILPVLKAGSLLARFHAKGRFEPLMRSLSVRVVLEPRAALLGAAHAAHAAASHSSAAAASPHPERTP